MRRKNWGINDWKSRCSELAFQVYGLQEQNAEQLNLLEKIDHWLMFGDRGRLDISKQIQAMVAKHKGGE